MVVAPLCPRPAGRAARRKVRSGRDEVCGALHLGLGLNRDPLGGYRSHARLRARRVSAQQSLEAPPRTQPWIDQDHVWAHARGHAQAPFGAVGGVGERASLAQTRDDSLGLTRRCAGDHDECLRALGIHHSRSAQLASGRSRRRDGDPLRLARGGARRHDRQTTAAHAQQYGGTSRIAARREPANVIGSAILTLQHLQNWPLPRGYVGPPDRMTACCSMLGFLEFIL